LVPVEEADVIIVLGGDGFMLESVHRFQGGTSDLRDEPGNNRLSDERVQGRYPG
jgi:hypothetical protein